MTGSHRSKLGELVLGAKGPFYGGSVQDFPVLGEDFVRTLIEQVGAARNVEITLGDGVAAFETLMYRPEAFMKALRNEIFESALSGELRSEHEPGRRPDFRQLGRMTNGFHSRNGFGRPRKFSRISPCKPLLQA